MGSKNEVSFEYCVGCRWGLRAAWLAQELLQTFEPDDGLCKVSLLPIKEPAGTFIVRVNNEKIWDRKEESTVGFPETKELKRIIRDRLCPAKYLGHSEKGSTLREEDTMVEKEKIQEVLEIYLEGVYEGNITKVMASTQQSDYTIYRRNELASTTISRHTSPEEWKDYLAWNRIISSDPLDRSVPEIAFDDDQKATAFVCSFIPAYAHMEPDKIILARVKCNNGDSIWRIQSHETARLYEQKSDGTMVRSLQSKLYREVMKDL